MAVRVTPERRGQARKDEARPTPPPAAANGSRGARTVHAQPMHEARIGRCSRPREACAEKSRRRAARQRPAVPAPVSSGRDSTIEFRSVSVGGGPQEGSVMRLYLLDLGVMQPGNVPVPGYLIRADDGRTILVDTGWPRSFVDTPRNPPGLSIEIKPEETVAARLAALGLDVSDIDYLICSHFDDDHSGNHDLFVNAELVVQREHYELARSGHPRFAANRAAWDHPSLRYSLVDGDVELVPGVELLETSGHVPGHQSVLVRLPVTGPVMLAIDAVMHSSMADAATREMFVTDMDDEARIRRSTRKVSDIAEARGAALVVYGHDADQWATLRRAPAFYE
ncbi:MAG: N-acyl homoserine lactonase family protein [Amaricoccus sp.]|uniref:N-acyl homoserine lactonase family protein n=1 Tax=Amaricoccus sp. TaxID=1872485 RepID=UPI0039E2FE36